MPFATKIGLLLSAATFLASGQSGGRFEETKRQALAYLESDQYDRAAGKLEEIWEQDHSDPTVAENLALAYLNGDDRRYHPEAETKARDLFEQSLHAGGRATFMVQHSHEKAGFFEGRIITNYCVGMLSVSPGRLVYVARARKGVEAHSFDVSADDVRLTKPDDMGVFTIKTKAKNYTLIPRNRIKGDSDVIVEVIREQLGTK
ncbi:MAG: hypothetical protein JO323_14205 [Acidobacteriia bacterium]|nr:hypothetical protein [Terriglobia bacterium]